MPLLVSPRILRGYSQSVRTRRKIMEIVNAVRNAIFTVIRTALFIGMCVFLFVPLLIVRGVKHITWLFHGREKAAKAAHEKALAAVVDRARADGRAAEHKAAEARHYPFS
jgi:hypothetical protein